MKNTLTIDAQQEIGGLNSGLFVLHFDKQGIVEWDKENPPALHVPETLNGLDVYGNLQREGKRPLNGHFAILLSRSPEHIPEEWKQWTMVFMGTVISHKSFIYHAPPAGNGPEHTCFKLWFEDDCWNVEPINFSSHPLKPEYRIPLLPS